MTRKFIGFGAKDIEARAQSHPEDIPELIKELQHRKSGAAKRLLIKLQSGGGNAPPPPPTQSDFFSKSSADTDSDGARNDDTTQAQRRRRERPFNWSKLNGFPPTDEQEKAVDHFVSGDSMKISAFAGTGKTSTLRFLAATAPKERGLYLAFNRSIAKEARSVFTAKTDCRTTHSAALTDLRPRYAFPRDKWFNDIGPKQLASAWQVGRYDAGAMILEPDMVTYLAIQAVKRFCQSGDDEVEARHVRLAGKALGLSAERRVELEEFILAMARQLWASRISEKSDIPLGHDGYLKLWSISKPQLAYSFVLLDEAQDTNPAVLSILKRQKTQMIYVGDKHQQIYEWRGAENAMETIEGIPETHLTMSFRFGPAIADAANRVLAALGESKSLVGNPNKRSEVVGEGIARAVLTRSNAMLFREIVNAIDNNMKPHVVGGTREMKALLNDVDRLQKGEPGARPEFFGFTNWAEVVEYAQKPEGENLAQFVNLVEQMGRSALWRAVLSTTDTEADADIVVSTAHKAKGREWKSVRLSEDFASAELENGRIPYSEARLFYVAMTRAEERLVVDPALLYAFTHKLTPDTPDGRRAAPDLGLDDDSAGLTE